MNRLRRLIVLTLIGTASITQSCTQDRLVVRANCGNGITEGAEQCDEADKNSETGSCTPACMKATCGDGFIGPGELCDNGALNSDTYADKCRLDCSPARCGDGVMDAGEECDDGNDISTDGCTTSCTVAICGNGIREADEECDDGNTENSDSCINTCILAFCGDGYLYEDHETCDNGSLNSDSAPDQCRTNCQPYSCGDGITDSDEQCDDGNSNPLDGCSTLCLTPICGNGLVEPGETCDDNNLIDTDSCPTNCLPATCGDGYVQTGFESCDEGALNSNNIPNRCRETCVAPSCGDGVTDTAKGEQCDDQNTDPLDGCSIECMRPICGNGIMEQGEECDDGNFSDSDACPASCKAAVCGDGFIQSGVEICDEGLLNSDTQANRCRENCTPSRCGDGTLDSGEQCDTASNLSDITADACRLDCQAPSCGDQVQDSGEECDDGNDDNTDDCTQACSFPICGDGFIHASSAEECDQGDNNSNTLPDACRDNCVNAFCGDGIQDSTEECDPQDAQDDRNCASNCELCGVSLLLPFNRHHTPANGGPTETLADEHVFKDAGFYEHQVTGVIGSGASIGGPPYVAEGALPYATMPDNSNNGRVVFKWKSTVEVEGGQDFEDSMTFGAGDFTIEFYKMSHRLADSSYDIGIMECNGSWSLQFGPNAGGTELSAYAAQFAGIHWLYPEPQDVWQHVAIVRHGNLWYFYVDGQQLPVLGTEGDEIPTYGYSDSRTLGTCTKLVLGQIGGSSGISWYQGEMDDLRITKGKALYTENFVATPHSALLNCP